MDDSPTQSLNVDLASPAPLVPEQEDLCRRLDEWHALNGLKSKPSEMFRGAIFVSRTHLRNNPDWIAQAANSLREIVYPFNGNNFANKEEALRQYGSVRANQPGFAREVGRVFGSFTELAHHGNGSGNSIDFSTFTAGEFDRLIADFERVMSDVLLRQIDIHQEVDDILALDPGLIPGGTI